MIPNGGKLTLQDGTDSTTFAKYNDNIYTINETTNIATEIDTNTNSFDFGTKKLVLKGIGSISIVPGENPTITTSSLPNGTIGISYSNQINGTVSSSGTFTISSGSLPSGLTLNPSTGAITGTPLGPSGTISFDVTLTDTVSNLFTTETLSITINASPSGPICYIGESKVLAQNIETKEISENAYIDVDSQGNLVSMTI